MLELLFGLAFWPWAMLLALLLMCGVSALVEESFIAFCAVVIFSGLTWFLYDAGPLVWIAHNPMKALFAIAVYAAIGVLWSWYRWQKIMSSEHVQKKLADARDKFLKEVPEGSKADFKASYRFPSECDTSHNSDRITNWITLWPFSAFLHFFDDILVNFFRSVYRMISGTYERITDRHIPD